MANRKEEMIDFLISDFNEKVDLSTILDEEGKTIFSENPFVPVLFRLEDAGQIKTTVTEIIHRLQKEPKRYIPVVFLGAELERENIFSPPFAIKSEMWTGIVSIEFVVPINSVDVYADVYEKLSTYQETNLVFRKEFLTFAGQTRRLDINSKSTEDVSGSISLLNSVDYKSIKIIATAHVKTSTITTGNDITFKVDSFTVTTFNKDGDFTAETENNTEAGNAKTKKSSNTATDILGFSVFEDFSSAFVRKFLDEIEDNGEEGFIGQTYVIERKVTPLSGTVRTNTADYILQSAKPTISVQAGTMWNLQFVRT